MFNSSFTLRRFIKVEGCQLNEGESFGDVHKALVAPSAREPQDALLVLSAMAGGNLVEVDGVPSLNPAVDRYRTAVARQRSPWAQADRMDEKRADDYRRWRPGA